MFQVTPNGDIDLHGATEYTINVKLNIPFGCAINRYFCDLQLQTFIDGANDCRVSALKTAGGTAELCGAQFDNRDVEQGNNIPILIRTVAGSNYKSGEFDSQFAIFFQISSSYHPYWNGTMLDTIRVRLT